MEILHSWIVWGTKGAVVLSTYGLVTVKSTIGSLNLREEDELALADEPAFGVSTTGETDGSFGTGSATTVRAFAFGSTGSPKSLLRGSFSLRLGSTGAAALGTDDDEAEGLTLTGSTATGTIGSAELFAAAGAFGGVSGASTPEPPEPLLLLGTDLT